MRRALMSMTAALLVGLVAALQGLSQTTSATPEAAERRRTEIRRAADSLFDFTEMSRRALGRHWADRTAAERDEFVRLFTDLIARSYIGKIDRYAGEAIAYTGERVDGDEASVRSQVVTAKGSQIPVEYRDPTHSRTCCGVCARRGRSPTRGSPSPCPLPLAGERVFTWW